MPLFFGTCGNRRPRHSLGHGALLMRILLVTSFPVPGDYDGTAMLPIKILRALKTRGVDVVLAHLKARRPWGKPVLGDFEGTPSYTFAPPSWLSGLRRIARECPFDVIHAQHY